MNECVLVLIIIFVIVNKMTVCDNATLLMFILFVVFCCI